MRNKTCQHGSSKLETVRVHRLKKAHMVVGVRAPWTEEATFISPDLRPGGLISWLFRYKF
jgi:hypothetical protein